MIFSGRIMNIFNSFPVSVEISKCLLNKNNQPLPLEIIYSERTKFHYIKMLHFYHMIVILSNDSYS